METQILMTGLDNTKYKFNRSYKSKTYYKCKNTFKLKCKSIVMFDSISDSYKLLTNHIQTCPNFVGLETETKNADNESSLNILKDLNTDEDFSIEKSHQKNTTNSILFSQSNIEFLSSQNKSSIIQDILFFNEYELIEKIKKEFENDFKKEKDAADVHTKLLQEENKKLKLENERLKKETKIAKQMLNFKNTNNKRKLNQVKITKIRQSKTLFQNKFKKLNKSKNENIRTVSDLITKNSQKNDKIIEEKENSKFKTEKNILNTVKNSKNKNIINNEIKYPGGEDTLQYIRKYAKNIGLRLGGYVNDEETIRLTEERTRSIFICHYKEFLRVRVLCETILALIKKELKQIEHDVHDIENGNLCISNEKFTYYLGKNNEIVTISNIKNSKNKEKYENDECYHSLTPKRILKAMLDEVYLDTFNMSNENINK